MTWGGMLAQGAARVELFLGEPWSWADSCLPGLRQQGLMLLTSMSMLKSAHRTLVALTLVSLLEQPASPD